MVTIMENQMEKKMENEMETGIISPYKVPVCPFHPCLQSLPNASPTILQGPELMISGETCMSHGHILLQKP